MTLYFFSRLSDVPAEVRNSLMDYDENRVQKWQEAGDEVISIFVIEAKTTYVLHIPSVEQKRALERAVREHKASRW